MSIMDLEDFECHAALLSALSDSELNQLAFSPMFVFLIDWAVLNGALGEYLRNSGVFAEQYPRLLHGEVSFSSFVQHVLKGKLEESFFSQDAVQFIADYIEYDGYVQDLTTVYSTNIGALPCNFDKTKDLHEAINASRKNYEENKRAFPDLVVFTDPVMLKQERNSK